MSTVSVTCGFCNTPYCVKAEELPLICATCHCTVDLPEREENNTQCLPTPKKSDGLAGSSTVEGVPPWMSPTLEKKKSRYSVESTLAIGGMGKILLVQDTHLQRRVAMKVLKKEVADKGWGQRFLLEAKITAQLDHPQIVPIYDLDTQADGSLYFTMKQVKGKCLADLLALLKSTDRERAERSLPRRLQIGQSICQAVAYAHSKGILHRDLKPHNVMIGEFGEVFLVDWGIAKTRTIEPHSPSARAISSGEASATQWGQMIGTPGYMAPEQVRGNLSEIDERSDVYGLGAILYELVILRPPFSGKDVTSLLLKSLREDPVIPKRDALGQRISPKLGAIILKAMAKSREDRYPDAPTVEKDLAHFLEGKPLLAYPEPIWEKLARLGKMNLWSTMEIGDGVLLLVVFLLFGWFLVHWEHARQQSNRSLHCIGQAHIYFDLGKECYDQKGVATDAQTRRELQREEDRHWERALIYIEEASAYNAQAQVAGIGEEIASLRKRDGK